MSSSLTFGTAGTGPSLAQRAAISISSRAGELICGPITETALSDQSRGCIINGVPSSCDPLSRVESYEALWVDRMAFSMREWHLPRQSTYRGLPHSDGTCAYKATCPCTKCYRGLCMWEESVIHLLQSAGLKSGRLSCANCTVNRQVGGFESPIGSDSTKTSTCPRLRVFNRSLQLYYNCNLLPLLRLAQRGHHLRIKSQDECP